MAAANLQLIELPLGPEDNPVPRDSSLDDLVFYVCKYLDQARNDDVPFAIVHTLAILRREAARGSGPHPSAEQGERMMQAALAARPRVVRFHDSEGCGEVPGKRGMDALMGLIALWTEKAEQRAARHPHTIPDLLDHAGIFRNDMRTAGMLADIEARAALRAEDKVTTLCPTYDEHAY